MVEKKIRKQGNSHAVYLPAKYLEALDLGEGDTVEISLDRDTQEIVIRNTKTAPLTEGSRFDRLVKDAVDKYLNEKFKSE